ncbi:MAG: AraC family transcriptional regulator [Candidatus Obscuribacterales bacterium]
MSKRILGVNKETGHTMPLVENSRMVELTSADCSWKFGLLELVYCGPYENPDLISLNPTICLLQSDSPVVGEIRLRGKTQRATFLNEYVSLIPSGEVGQWSCQDPHNTLMFSINSGLFADIALDAGLPADGDLPLAAPLHDEFVRAVMLALREEARCGFASGQMYGDSIATALAAHLMTKYSLSKHKLTAPKGKMGTEAVNEVIDWLNEHYTKDVSVADLSEQANLSPYHFCRMFKTSTGMTPHQYLIKIRLKAARELVKSDNTLTLKQIAQRVGFFDASHLSRHFKRMYGINLMELKK